MGENIHKWYDWNGVNIQHIKQLTQLSNNRKQLYLKMCRRTNGHFSKEERQMANSNMKILSITNHQKNTIKTTVRYHFTLVRMTVTKRNTTHVGEDVEKREPLYTVGGNANWYRTRENSMKIPQKTKNRAIIWPKNSTPEYISSKQFPLIWKDMYMPMFKSALFKIAKIWKQPLSINR